MRLDLGSQIGRINQWWRYKDRMDRECSSMLDYWAIIVPLANSFSGSWKLTSFSLAEQFHDRKYQDEA